MRNYKTPKLAEGQSVKYTVIHVAKRGISPYPLGVYTPPKIDRGPPCGEAVIIVGEFPIICKREEFLLSETLSFLHSQSDQINTIAPTLRRIMYL
jgi:hypothetical protein